MSVSKVGLCTINDSSDVTMIKEDGVIAEMIIEVDDENNPEPHGQFAFELDEEDDCVEIYSSGFASTRNEFIERSESHDWMCSGIVMFGGKDANGGKEISPGLCNLNLLDESDVDHDVPVIKSVVGSEQKVHDCIVIDDRCDNKSRRKSSKKLPFPKSSMVTRGKAAANKIPEDFPKEVTENETVENGSRETNNCIENRDNIGIMKTSKLAITAGKGSELDEVNDSVNNQMSEMNCQSLTMDEKSVGEQLNVPDHGVKLVDIIYIRQIIQNARRLGLRALYKLTYGHHIPKDVEIIRDRLLQFNGFPFGANSVEFVRKMKTLKMFPDAAIKQICHILGTQLGSKDDMSLSILKFLLKPKQCQSDQFMSSCYQPRVKLERLSEELVKFETIEGKLVEMLASGKKGNCVRKQRKRKPVIQSSDVRITRSAKRLMEDNEGDKVVNPKKRSLSCDSTTQENLEEEAASDEGLNFQTLQDTSDDESASVKGTQGLTLGDFKEIRQNIEKCDTKALQRLHSVLYNRLDKAENWKKNILRFSGFNFKCVSSRWRKKEFVLSLMSACKLKEIADLLHLQYYSVRSQKSLTLNIMKFLSKPREGLLKHCKFSPERRGRCRMVKIKEKKANSFAELGKENTSLEVESLLQDIRQKRQSSLCEDSSTESDMPFKNAARRSKKKKLGDIPNVQFMIITSNYEDIDNLHQLLFLQSGPRAKIRRNVQNFDGFMFGPGSFSYKIRIKLLSKMGYEVAKRIAFFLGLTSLGTTIPQQDLNDLIMHFLMCPSDIKCRSIKAYPKNFFNNYPTRRPVVDITSIRNAVKKKMKSKRKSAEDVKLHSEMSQDIKVPECEKSGMKCDISEDINKIVIKTEREDQHSDPSKEFVMDRDVISSNISLTSQCGDSNEKIVNNVEKLTDSWGKRQERVEVPLVSSSKVVKRKFSYADRRVHTSAIGKKKKVALKKECNKISNDVKPDADNALNKQFLFRFDPTNKFDSKKLLEYLNRESKNLVQKVKDTKTEVKDSVQAVLPNIPLKVTPKPELPGSPKVISILLPPPPPPPQSPQKQYSVVSDLSNKTNSSSSNSDCAPSLQNALISSSSSVTSHPGGKLPIPPLPKKPLLHLIPQSSQLVQPSTTSSSSMTQIRVPSSVIESIKGSQIDGVIRFPQNFLIGQRSVKTSSSSFASDVLSLPEVQKCLQQINSANGKDKHVKMVKIAGNNAVPLQPSALNVGGGKVYVIPVKPSSQQFSSLPISPAVTPLQLSNHIVVPSSVESGTPVNIPQLIQVAKNYSRTVGTTALPISNVTVTKMKPDLLSSVPFPVVSATRCVFPVSVAPNGNIAPLSVVKIKNNSEKEVRQKEPPVVINTTKAEAEVSKESQGVKQQKEDCSSDSELDEEPLSHLVGHPSDDMLLQNIKDIVTGADLSSVTMRNVLQKVFAKYPQYDLTYRKSFLKDTVKKVICSTPSQKAT